MYLTGLPIPVIFQEQTPLIRSSRALSPTSIWFDVAFLMIAKFALLIGI